MVRRSPTFGSYAKSVGYPFTSFLPVIRAKAAGFRDDAVYLVRPDGYLGAVVNAGGAAASLTEYLDTHGIRCR